MLIYLQLQSNRLKIFVPLTVMGLAVMLPINLGGGFLTTDNSVGPSADVTTTNTTNNGTSTNQLLYSSIDKLSISNVPNKSMRLVSHDNIPHIRVCLWFIYNTSLQIPFFLLKNIMWEWDKLDNMNNKHLITCKCCLTSTQRAQCVF